MRLNLHQHLLSVLLALYFVVFISDRHSHVEAIRLNANGGYDIVIGVEENTIEPMNANYFLDEIRVGIDSFSTELWKATNQRFFINSVDVLVPGNWWTVGDFQFASWQTLKNSEIRITEEVSSPNVVNPNPCGTAGLYVELPDNFFKTARGGQYGAIGKALVNLWARYRFGVWEEHGIPGDMQFPYFYAHPSFEPKWEATGCANEELTGTYRTIDDEETERCDPYRGESPGDDCRFVPSPLNTANSSLLQFHWLDSIVSFCDSKSHNHAAPNRQNLFCSHRSVWEVIRESEDYQSTKTCMESVGRPQFRVLKESRSPEFYLLIDRGRTVTPEKVLREVMGAMNKFVSFPSLERINIAVGTYPHANQGKNHYYVKEEIGWAPISSVIYELHKVLNESSNPEGPPIRDFGLAIQEVAEKIKARDHQAGSVILIIKRGAGPNIFDKLTFEQEVIASIKEDNRISVFAIEAQQGVDMPYTNLQSLVEETGGRYHVINDTANTARKLVWLLDDVQVILEQSSIMRAKSSWVTQKQYTEPDQTVHIPIYDDVTSVKIHLTTSRQLVDSQIILRPTSEVYDLPTKIEKGEWDENSDLSRRVVHTYHIRNPQKDSQWILTHECHSKNPEDCRFFLLVTAETDRPMPRDIQLPFNSKSISIDVSTSSESNYVDMNQKDLKLIPFSIFAKIEMDRQRVLGLEIVTALVRLGGDHDAHRQDWLIPLTDDGSGLPDISANDGIYSAVFTPLEDGLYQISVSASGISEEGGSSFQNTRLVRHAGALMPENQLSFGCMNSSKPRCVSAVPRGSFSRVQDMPATVAVENAATFKAGKPMKIMDFTVTTLPNYNVEFEFTSPKLLGSDESPDEFWIYMAPHIDNFIGSTDLTKVLIKEIGKPPGTRVKIPYNAQSSAIPYYAVEAIYGGQKGGPSNVIGVVTSDIGPILPSPTTVPTTTVSPTTVSTSTTEYPWPTTTPTTQFPYSTTAEESEETDLPEPSTSSTTEPPTSSSSTTSSPSSTTTEDGGATISSSSTTEVPSTTSEAPISISTSEAPSSTTTEAPTSTSGAPSTTSEAPISTSDISDAPSSTTTEAPTSTSEAPSTTSEAPISTSDISDAPSSTTTEAPTSTSEAPSTTTNSPSSSSTTETPIITDPVPTTSSPTSTTQEPELTTPASSSTSTDGTTELPTSSSTSTTEAPPISSDITGPISSSTTPEPSSSTPDEDISPTTSTEPPSTAPPSSTTTADPTSTPVPTESTVTTTTEQSVSSTTTPATTTTTESSPSTEPETTPTSSTPPPSSSSLSTSEQETSDPNTTASSSSFSLASSETLLCALLLSSLYIQRAYT